MTVDDHRTRGDAAGLTLADVIERAGVEAGFVERLVDGGLITAGAADGFTEGDVRRARILHDLDASGLPIAAIGQAVRQGALDLGFVDDPAYGLFAGPTSTTFEVLSERSSIPLELLFTIRESMGSAQPAPDDRVRFMELQVVPALELMLFQGVRPHVVERALRAYGDSIRKMTEVQADWWMSDIMQPLLATGLGMAEFGARTAEFSTAYTPLDDQMVLALYHGHQTSAWMKNIFEGFETALERAGLHTTTDRPPAICFLDLSGYTRLTDERGDAAAADLAGRLSRLVQRTSSQHGGRPIKWLGDGVMFHFRDPGPGVLAALEMVEGAKQEDLPPAHVGLHAGPVLFQEGDYFGRTVNVASRIADYARQGEVLVSDEVVAASTVEGVRFDPIGPVELKGLTETVSLHVARRAT